MEGLIDIYMPDLKYSNDSLGQRYSNVPDYFSVASEAILEMYRQVGGPVINNGVMLKGLLIRHLVLPGLSGDSISVLDWIKTHTPLAGVNLMPQYRPAYRANEFKEINQSLTSKEFRLAESHLHAIGLNKGWK